LTVPADPSGTPKAAPGLEELLRELAPQVLGSVARWFGDFDAAEDAVQEALLAAATQWPRDGVPDHPRGWLVQVAGRRMTDHIRAEVARRRREELAALRDPDRQVVDGTGAPEHDDTLLLLFMCCHPSLTPASQIALTLRAVGGLTTGEIAAAFLVPEATMAQRISRAKQRLTASGRPVARPGPGEWSGRLRAVLHVLYLIFNEGYASSSGPALQRSELAGEAIRLTRLVHRLLPAEPEVAGLLALLLLTDARREARTGADGLPVPLDEQDRSRWEQALIDEGVAVLSAALPAASPGPYQLQAAIAALHDEAPSAKDTDWPQILALYGLLERVSPSPVVTLNRAVALAMVRGPDAGLELLASLESDDRLAGHHRLAAVRAHLQEMSGEHTAAVAGYRLAARRTTNAPERDYLIARAARLAAADPSVDAP
jgi:RNA polymerase sigma factor (sigma-70 family)